jgi:threonine dehydrogenase-like Zn-dependent dehydrogenase
MSATVEAVSSAPRSAVGVTRAAVIDAPRSARIDLVPLPAPPADHVRIRLEGSGVCASNLPVWEGREWFSYPLEAGAPGHEGWGVIDAVGDEIRDFAVGDRVAALTYHAYAEHDLAAHDAMVLLPPELRDAAFPGEPLGCAMNIFARSEIRAGQTVAIVGIGFLGALLTQLASAAGARVIAISRRPFALDVARNCGAHETIVMDDHGRIIERVMSLTSGEGCDRVIEAVGLQWPLDLAGELTRIRGKLIIAGFHQDGPRNVNMQLWNWRGLDVVNAHERDPRAYLEGMRAAVAAVAGGVLDPSLLYTHRFPLDRVGEALEASRTRPDGFLKALVVA